ncbi:hypothetical protein [Colwellia sp. PAMC 21821]|uniref:hypothetical protein n=1 Tax=Colwellia sp. PAMC 21821 TaxID=1816219 RepID=UPI0009C14BF3|nr:hypothetical protein [Colwellia sp. PAMC 21821]ARD45898.1 hypothetical protein A3Q33_17330 [Colwellia sp. PAMC 21821]
MNEFNIPVHTTRTLIKAGVIAFLVATTLLVTCILPAEYNIDPTGIGKTLGLTAIAEASEKSPTLVIERGTQNDALRTDDVEIIVPAGNGLEYKLNMEKHAHVEYEWKTDGEALYFDFHGEPAGDKTGYFESFSITTSSNMKGSLTTPFKGSHGWYWKNQSQQPVTVSLSIKGYYTIKG